MEEENTQTQIPKSGNKNLIILVAVIIVIALVAIGWLVLTKNKQQSVTQSPAENTTTESTVEPTESSEVPES